MTHDELLDCIDKFDAAVIIGQPAIKALRSVVELHKPKPFGLIPSGFICAGCDNRCGCYEGDMGNYNDWFTCPTIQAIKKGLA